MTATLEELPPQMPSLPSWPSTPPPVDVTGGSFLVLRAGGGEPAAAVARDWVAAAEATAATGGVTVGELDDVGAEALAELLAQTRTGVRVMLVGGQFEVLQLLALLRVHGALGTELRSFVTDTTEIPVFCGHCQTVSRARAAPGDEVDCGGCTRHLAVHEHLAVQLGCFLASDTGEPAR